MTVPDCRISTPEYLSVRFFIIDPGQLGAVTFYCNQKLFIFQCKNGSVTFHVLFPQKNLQILLCPVIIIYPDHLICFLT